MHVKKFNECLERIRNGDNNGIIPIHDEYRRRMCFTAASIVGDMTVAEDIASDFMKHLLEKAKTIGYVENPNAWIHSSVRNRAIDYVRKDSKLLPLYTLDEVACTYIDDKLFSTLSEALQFLEESERDIVIQHYVYGFPYKDVAASMNIPVGSIKRRVHEIKEKLRPLIKRK